MATALVSAPCPIRIGRTLDDDTFCEIRRQMELSHYKWDAQVGDVTSLAPFPLLVDSTTWRELAMLAEQLTRETLAVERELVEQPTLHTSLGLPRQLRALFAPARRPDGAPRRVPSPTPAAARVMRFDFHFTTEGWRVSEVNSDVPGGYTEATSFTQLMAQQNGGARPAGDPTTALVGALIRAAGDRGTIALTCAPGHMEDHQVVGYLAAALRQRGLSAHVVAPSHVRWVEGERGARMHIESAEWSGSVDAFVRFYQVEWLARLRRQPLWTPLFVGGATPVSNPGVAMLSESKRLPLIWDRLRTPLVTWRRLLPETRQLRAAPWASDDEWLIKSAFCNTGDTVSIRSGMTAAAWRRRSWSARLSPARWLAQRRFDVVPIHHNEMTLRPCIGVYTVDGAAAGAYARIASRGIVVGAARDAALLVTEDA